nr:immunoglobulin heavy chain junction region [Macaca mulatta]MOY17981.1 immunoglobulin heavy chain junction region [Macaca mulatta]MOY17986.1 immunoglobulin heavy chain junction region [Macaca mulatta]MOY17987.1 immunoglobulin heavy chain junction region [Macaca mulatta]MOY17994.1 immunoglobulin heavy chain junction region [Macaca mulatta]
CVRDSYGMGLDVW